MNQSTLNKLNQMHLWGMEATLKGIMGNVQNDSLTADELIDLLVQAEWDSSKTIIVPVWRPSCGPLFPEFLIETA